VRLRIRFRGVDILTYILFATLTLLVAAVAIVAFRSRRQKRYPKPYQLIDSSGIVETELDPQGAVQVHGELWLAQSISGKRIQRGTAIRVMGVSGHVLLVAQA
jgi:membrane-bound serine protease (ClpP class)